PFVERIWRTGRIGLDEDRIAHISPPVEGVVKEVPVKIGQSVQAGSVLAILDCKEVGQAKLELVKTRLALSLAKSQSEWQGRISKNVEELIDGMERGVSLAKLDEKFKDRPIGDWRQQVISAFSKRSQLKTNYDSLKGASSGAISETTYLRVKAEYEAAEATYRALLEEIRFQAKQQAQASQQKLREAQTAESVSQTQLMMMGFPMTEIETMNPIAEGQRVSMYPIRAPFPGNVVEKHAVLGERVNPQLQMFQIADMSEVWIRADIFERDLPLVVDLTGHKVTCRIPSWANQTFEAEVRYTGDLLDKASRAVALIASAPNPKRLLKPGMFIEVELKRTMEPALQIPQSAVQYHGKQTFVFIHLGEDRFRRQDVDLGDTSGSLVMVKSGLKHGESIVAEGGFLIKSELFRDQLGGD
ncbi:MAG: efflux RND transporter periplasmic adaptor subunit, partial [Gemmataceae bacterium]